MINLIPGVVKKTVIKEYWIRVTSVFLALFALGAGLCVLFALPVYVIIDDRVESLSVSAMQVAEKLAISSTTVNVLQKSSDQAKKLIDQKSVINFSTIFSQIENIAGTETVISNYEFSRKDADVAPFVISGESTTRQALADFHSALKKQSWVEKVDLPISNLAKEKEVIFSMTVTYKEE